MNASIQRNAGPEPAKSPRPRAGNGYTGCDPHAGCGLLRRVQMLECCSEADHFIEPFRLNALRLRLMFRLAKREAPFKVRLQIIPDLDVAGFAHAAGDASPQDPELRPDRLVFVKPYALSEQRGGLL